MMVLQKALKFIPFDLSEAGRKYVALQKETLCSSEADINKIIFSLNWLLETNGSFVTIGPNDIEYKTKPVIFCIPFNDGAKETFEQKGNNIAEFELSGVLTKSGKPELLRLEEAHINWRISRQE